MIQYHHCCLALGLLNELVNPVEGNGSVYPLNLIAKRAGKSELSPLMGSEG